MAAVPPRRCSPASLDGWRRLAIPRRWPRRSRRRCRFRSSGAPSSPAPRKNMCAAALLCHTPTSSCSVSTSSCPIEEHAVPNIRSTLAIALLLAAGLDGIVLGQDGSGMGAPVGGPSGNFLGPPQGTVGDFLGDWKMTWDGHVDSRCPCHGRLTISVGERGDVVGYWDT